MFQFSAGFLETYQIRIASDFIPRYLQQTTLFERDWAERAKTFKSFLYGKVGGELTAISTAACLMPICYSLLCIEIDNNY